MMLIAYDATIRSRKALSWAVFAFQSYIDVYRELGNEVDRGLAEMRSSGASIIQTIKDLHHYQSKHNPHGFDLSAFTDLVNHMEEITQLDVSTRNIICFFKPVPEFVEQASAWGAEFWLKNDPFQCGLYLNRCYYFLHDKGVEQDCSGAIFSTMHLYNMALQNALLPKNAVWADVEYLIQKQDESYIFVGDRPQTMKDCAKRFLLAIGVSATKLARTDRTGASIDLLTADMVPVSKNRRQMPYFSTFVQQLWGKHSDTKLRQNDSVGAAYMRRGVVLERMVTAHIDSRAKNTGVPPLRNGRHMLSHLDMLPTFKEAVHEDAFPCRFDAASLGLPFTHFLRSVQQLASLKVNDSAFPDTVRKILGRSIREDFLHPPNHGIWILLGQLIEKHGSTIYHNTVADLRVMRGPLLPAEEDEDLATERILNRTTTVEAMEAWMNRKFGPQYGHGGKDYVTGDEDTQFAFEYQTVILSFLWRVYCKYKS
jgi:hypothetical protein